MECYFWQEVRMILAHNHMNFHFEQSDGRGARRLAAFTLIEIVLALAILGMVMSGLIYGYVQANRMAEWSSMSLAGQSFASQGAEIARSAHWLPRQIPPVDDLPAQPNTNLPPLVDFMDIPTKGTPNATNFQFWVTNYTSISNLSDNPHLREIRSYSVWSFPRGSSYISYTNWVILDRAGDQ